MPSKMFMSFFSEKEINFLGKTFQDFSPHNGFQLQFHWVMKSFKGLCTFLAEEYGLM